MVLFNFIVPIYVIFYCSFSFLLFLPIGTERMADFSMLALMWQKPKVLGLKNRGFPIRDNVNVQLNFSY